MSVKEDEMDQGQASYLCVVKMRWNVDEVEKVRNREIWGFLICVVGALGKPSMLGKPMSIMPRNMEQCFQGSLCD